MTGGPAAIDQLRRAQSWEDPTCLREALAPHAESRILSLDAAGDSSLALLLQGAGRVVSVDRSQAQCAIIELKRAAIRTLDYEELLGFVGATPGSGRAAMYARARRELPIDARAYWDAHPGQIAAGILHVGRFEEMWRTFRTRVLPFAHTPTTRRAAFEPRSRMAREEFWHERWNTRRWQVALRTYFSRPRVARIGRDPSYLDHAAIDLGRHAARRAYHAFVELDPSRNPFLQYTIFGRCLDVENEHPWLARRKVAILCDRLDDLEVHCDDFERYLGSGEAGEFTGCNLSDCFEYMSSEQHDRAYRMLIEATTRGATLAYWDDLVSHSAPSALVQSGVVAPDTDLAVRLHDMDRSFLHRAFHVDRVLESTKPPA